MAKVTNQAIPPSLKAEYSDVLRVPRATPPFNGTVGIIPSARGRPGLPMPKATLRYVQDAVRWLYDNWRPLESGIDPALWRAERRAEIVRLEFPAPYWYQINATEDQTDYGTPTIDPWAGELNPAWYDEQRYPSICRFGPSSSSYATPPGAGTPQAPRPGWAGTVIDGIWRDLWLAQRRLTYVLPVPAIKDDKRPLIAALEGSIHAQADFRGLKQWFALCTWPRLYADSEGPPADLADLYAGWIPSFSIPIGLPPDLPSDWTCTANARVLRVMNYRAAFKDAATCNRLSLKVTTPPSGGLYFGRNDDVSITHYETIRVHQARGRNG